MKPKSQKKTVIKPLGIDQRIYLYDGMIVEVLYKRGTPYIAQTGVVDVYKLDDSNLEFIRTPYPQVVEILTHEDYVYRKLLWEVSLTRPYDHLKILREIMAKCKHPMRIQMELDETQRQEEERAAKNKARAEAEEKLREEARKRQTAVDETYSEFEMYMLLDNIEMIIKEKISRYGSKKLYVDMPNVYGYLGITGRKYEPLQRRIMLDKYFGETIKKFDLVKDPTGDIYRHRSYYESEKKPAKQVKRKYIKRADKAYLDTKSSHVATPTTRSLYTITEDSDDRKYCDYYNYCQYLNSFSITELHSDYDVE